jgi:hypothetical protein
MSGEPDGTCVQFWDLTDGPAETPTTEAACAFVVYVIFTGAEGTLAALRTAGALAKDLHALVSLLAFQHVPLQFLLSQPPISIAFSRQRLVEMVNQAVQPPLAAAARLCLCRNKRLALRQALPPKSLVVIGGKKRAWPTREKELEKQLIRLGHQVIFAELK